MDTARAATCTRSLAGRGRLADRPIGWPRPRVGCRASRQSGSNKKQGSCWPLLLLSNLLQRSKFLSKLVPKPKFETEQKLNDEAPFKVQQTWKKRVGKCWCIRIKIYGALAFAQPPIAWVCTTVHTVSFVFFLICPNHFFFHYLFPLLSLVHLQTFSNFISRLPNCFDLMTICSETKHLRSLHVK